MITKKEYETPKIKYSSHEIISTSSQISKERN